METPKKQNSFMYILSLPFLGIFYVVDFILKAFYWFFLGLYIAFKPLIIFLKYVSLGCFYVSYVIFFPFIYISQKIIDLLFNHTKKTEENIIKIEEYMPNDETDNSSEIQNTIQEQPTNKSFFSNLYNNIYLVKRKKEKEKKQIRDLINEVKHNNYRSEKPLVFKYTALDGDKKISNIFIAFSKLEVLAYLQNEGLKVLKIETSKLLNVIYDPSRGGTYKLKNKDLIFWLTQLSTYLKAGIPLTQAMQILSKQMSKNRSKKRLFDYIIYNLTLGESFSSALSKQGRSFPALLVSMIKTAEATGKLEETLDDMADYYTEIENTRKAMITAMTYPAIISLFSLGVVTFMLLYIIPQFQDIYNQAGAKINSFTLLIINISKYLKDNIFRIILVVILLILLIIILYQRVKAIRGKIQTLLMHIPLLGKIIIYKEMTIFTKTFSSLLQNNVFITESMTLLSEVTNNEIYKNIMYKTINFIAKGDKISTAFKDHWAIPEVAYYMIVTGESTGELASMMAKVSDYYQTQHKTIINSLKSFIEPVLIVFLAVVVGGIILAVVLPLFKMYEQIQ